MSCTSSSAVTVPSRISSANRGCGEAPNIESSTSTEVSWGNQSSYDQHKTAVKSKSSLVTSAPGIYPKAQNSVYEASLGTSSGLSSSSNDVRFKCSECSKYVLMAFNVLPNNFYYLGSYFTRPPSLERSHNKTKENALLALAEFCDIAKDAFCTLI
jgi:hypothetical protein